MEEGLPLVDDFCMPIGQNGPIGNYEVASIDVAIASAPPSGGAELISTLAESTTCQTDEERDARHAIEYGDLPKQLWKERKVQEDWWMSPQEGTGQAYRDIYSQGFASPFRCIVIGTNGTYAFAFYANDHENKVPIPKLEQDQKLDTHQRAAVQETLYAAYAKNNPCFAYKWSTTQFEREAMYASSRFSITNEIKTRDEAKTKNEVLQSMTKVDLALVKPIAKLGKLLSDQYRNLPEKCEDRTVKFEERKFISNAACKTPLPPPPEGVVEGGVKVENTKVPPPPSGAAATAEGQVEIDTSTVSPPPAAALAVGTTFSLMINKVPRPKKATAWKITDFNFVCEPKTAPIACFNSTHLYVLFQLPQQNKICCRMFELSPQDGSGHFIKLQGEFAFDIPNDFGSRGLFNAALGEQGELAVAVASGVVFFPRPEAGGKTPLERKHFILVQSKQDVQVDAKEEVPGPSAPEPPMITSLTILSSQHHLAIGTENGECHIIDYKEDTVVMRMVTAAIEPIFSVHLSTHGKCVMLTVMNLSGSINPYNANPDVLELRRPVAIAGCGSLLFVLTKYGFVNVINCNARNVYRIFEPPKEVFDVPSLQHAYKGGIFAAPDHFVCVLHNGVVRRTELFKRK